MKRIFSFYKKSFLVFNVNKVEFYNLVSSLFNKMFKILVILFIKQKSVWSNIFWYVTVCIFWKCIQYTIHWGKHEC